MHVSSTNLLELCLPPAQSQDLHTALLPMAMTFPHATISSKICQSTQGSHILCGTILCTDSRGVWCASVRMWTQAAQGVCGCQSEGHPEAGGKGLQAAAHWQAKGCSAAVPGRRAGLVCWHTGYVLIPLTVSRSPCLSCASWKQKLDSQSWLMTCFDAHLHQGVACLLPHMQMTGWCSPVQTVHR